MSLILSVLLLVIGFILLVKGADILVEGAVSIARRFEISDLVIGLTVVSFGTSAPELFVSVTASLGGSAGIATGNILGSNIANIFLILGASSLIYPLTVSRGTVWREIPFSLLAALVLWIASNDRLIDGWAYTDISRSEGLIFLVFFALFLYYTASIARSINGNNQDISMQSRGLAASAALTIAGLTGLALGGKLIVDSAVKIAMFLGMSQEMVGLTIVAVGTSLPELATSAMAALRKNAEIAVGNVVGSNIFNIFWCSASALP